MSKVKDFFKYNAIASLYLTLFVVSQCIAMFGVMFYFLYTNEDFINLFIEKLGPLYEVADSFTGYLENYDLMLIGYMDLLTELITPTLFISNLFIIIIVGIIIFVKRKKENLINKVSKKETLHFISIGVVLNLIISLILSLVMMILPSGVGEGAMNSYSTTIEGVLTGSPIILMISSGIIAPIAEEFIFRYGIQKNLSKFNVKFAIIYQALLFGLLHGNLIQFSYAFVLGLIFGYITYKKGNIMYSILLHIAINLSSVLISILFTNEYVGFAVFVGVLALLNLVVYLFSKKNNNI